MVAVSEQVDVGVDLEEKHCAAVTSDLLQHFCSAPERSWIGTLPAAERAERFYTLWTLKEALTKAEGSGVSLSLDRVDVLDCLAAAGITNRMSAQTRNLWFASPLRAPSEYAAAVASIGQAARILQLDVPADGRGLPDLDQARLDPQGRG